MVLLALVLCISSVSAQIDFKSHTGYFDMPASPEAAMLHNFQETPVNLSTGTPNISVPLVSCGLAHYPVNVSLNYHSNGLRVNQIPEAVGLGWNMNQGATINRIPRGILDERDNGFIAYSSAFNHSDVLDELADGSLAFLEQAKINCIDLLSDIYQVNLPDKNFSFTFNWNGEIVHNASDSIRIDYDINSELFTQWRITVDDGHTYIFNGSDAEVTDINLDDLPLTAGCAFNLNGYRSTWNVSRIHSPHNAVDQYDLDIVFGYEDYVLARNWSFSESRSINLSNDPCGGPPFLGNLQSNGSATTIYGKRIATIRGNNHQFKIDFFYTKDREDTQDLTMNATNLVNTSNFKSLDSIHYFVENDVLHSNLHFNYDYNNRLKLNSICSISSTNNDSILVSGFEYVSGNLPNYASRSVDYWGFYNGKFNTTLIPQYYIGPPHGVLEGADRTSDPEDIRTGVLKKIIHPTGGYTEFDFEANRFRQIAAVGANAYLGEEALHSAGATASAYNNTNATFTIEVPQPEENDIIELKMTLQFGTSITFAGHEFVPRVIVTRPDGSSFAFQADVHSPSSPDPQTQEIIYDNSQLTIDGGTGILTEAGTYSFEVIATQNSENWLPPSSPIYYDYAQCYVTVNKVINPSSEPTAAVTDIGTTVYGGGLRIAAVRSYSEAGEIATQKDYTYHQYTDEQLSYASDATESGILSSPISHVYSYILENIENGCYLESNMRSISGANRIASYSRPSVVYTAAQEFEYNTETNGLRCYNYNFEPDPLINDYPFPDPIDLSYTSSLLDSIVEYKFDNGAFKKVSSSHSTYTFHTHTVPQTYVGQGEYVNNLPPPHESEDLYHYAWITQHQKYGFAKPSSQINRTYFDNSVSSTDHFWQKEEMFYDDNLYYLEKSKTSENNSKELVTDYTYFSRYDLPNSYHSTENKFLITPKESISYYAEGNQTEVVGHVQLQYSNENDYWYPVVIREGLANQYNGLNPIGNLQNNLFISDYDQFGKPTFFAELDKNTIAERNDRELPVVNCSNCNRFSHWAYSSFEPDYLGWWEYNTANTVETNAYMGSHAYQLDGNPITFNEYLSLYDEDIITFTLSYYTLTDDVNISLNQSMVYQGTGATYSEWTYKEIDLVLDLTVNPDKEVFLEISGNGKIDELRFHAAVASMSSFSYDEYDNMIEVNDINNNKNTYEFDNFHRYSLSRDHNEYIREKIGYNFKIN